jgi:hypothetical protein
MTTRYNVTLDDRRTVITERPDGDCPRWRLARAAAISHLEKHIAACGELLWVLQHSGSFWEYRALMKEKAVREETNDGERPQVHPGDTPQALKRATMKGDVPCD